MIDAEGWVRGRLTGERLLHVMRVVTVAERLAERHRLSGAAARQAALLHDGARDLSPSELLDAAQELGVAVSEVARHSPVLLHGPVAAALAEQELGVTDAAVLDAVRYHTTGRPGMGPLEKLVYVADYIEPERRFDGVEAVRQTADGDLDAAVRLALDQTICHLIKRGALIDPLALLARNELLLATERP